MSSVAMLPWWSARDSAEQFHATGRGSVGGHESSQWPAYHGAGLKGSCAALGATSETQPFERRVGEMREAGHGAGHLTARTAPHVPQRRDGQHSHAKNGLPAATARLMKAMETLPTTAVV
jgi:hypothetical protein